jgi:DNA-directed RNA polymerase specialized sigma24 family protein
MADWLTQKFEENRPHLRAAAYRMLGSLGEADDAVQEASTATLSTIGSVRPRVSGCQLAPLSAERKSPDRLRHRG